MGDESEAVFLPLFDHDIHVRCCFCAEYIGWGITDVDVLVARRMGRQEVEKETAGLVEGRLEEVDEKDHDMWEKRNGRGTDINRTASRRRRAEATTGLRQKAFWLAARDMMEFQCKLSFGV